MKIFKLSCCVLIVITCCSLPARAQEYSREFGKIGKPEAEMTTWPADKSAEAVVLFDIGKSYFAESDVNFDVIFERAKRIKIFNDAGVNWGEVKIPFYHEGGIYEQVYDIEAYTYNPSGESFTKSALNLSTCYDEKINQYWTYKKFALPDVKAGSIIEYRYKIKSQYKFNLRDWEFQSMIPTLYSEYEVRIIPFYEYVYVLQNASKFDSKTSHEASGVTRTFGPVNYNDIVNNFVMKNVPAFKDEEYTTSSNDYIIKLEFQLSALHSVEGVTTKVVSTWPDLVKDILKDEGVTKFAKKCEKLLPKLISPDSLANKTQKEKFDMIINYMKANFSWNKINGIYASKSPNELLKDKLGNPADLNLLAIGLLNAAGIEAWPLFISTRTNGKIKMDYPLLQSFNYLIINAVIDGKSILSDATEILSRNDRIPSKCLSDKGLLIKTGPVTWLPLQSTIPSEIKTNFKIDSIGNNPKANISISASEYDALNLRSSYGEDKKKIAERENTNGYVIDESTISVLNQYDKEQPYVMNYNSAYKTEMINKKIYISPFCNEPITENPLKQSSRTYPIDMSYPVKRTYNSTITIPEGYKVDFVPENSKILNDNFELNYNVTQNGNQINIMFDYTFKKPIYDAKEYINLKYYFKDIIKKGNEKVVFVQNS
jgi:transglutaminase-like putative cysteine protease